MKPIKLWEITHEVGLNATQVALKKSKHLASMPTLPKQILGVRCDNRLGALEVQLSANWNGQNQTHVLHSKIVSGRWPSMAQISDITETVLEQLKFQRHATRKDAGKGS